MICQNRREKNTRRLNKRENLIPCQLAQVMDGYHTLACGELFHYKHVLVYVHTCLYG